MDLADKRSRSFSLELDERGLIKCISLPEGSGDRLMIEGFIGELTEVELIEDILLQIKATNGVLRIDLTRDELKKALRGKKM